MMKKSTYFTEILIDNVESLSVGNNHCLFLKSNFF